MRAGGEQPQRAHGLAQPRVAPRSVREEQAFRVRSSALRDAQGNTVVEPFHLVTAERGREPHRRSSVVEEMRQREQAECTFRPQTMEGASRRVIQEILAE